MVHRLPAPLLSFALGLALALPGCQGPPAYQVLAERTQKDVVRILVHLERRLEPSAYDAIAREEIARARRAAWSGEAPLYEVQVDFILDGPEGLERLATCSWRGGAPETADAGAGREPQPDEGLR